MQSSQRGSARPERAIGGSLRALCAGAAVALAVSPRAAMAEPERLPEEAPELDPSDNGRGRRVILLVRTEHDDGTMSRLRTELSRSDWTILEVRLDERLPPSPLGEIANAQNASAAVRVDAAQKAVEIWVSRPTGDVSETVGAEGERGGERVLSLRAFEALRARGLELTPAPTERVPEPAPARPRVERDAPERTSSPSAAPAGAPRVPALWLGAGAALLSSPGGLDPLVSIVGEGRFDFAEIGSIAAFGIAPVSRQSVSGQEGSALVRTWLAGTTLEIEWARPSVLSFRSGAGAGAGVTTMTGSGGPGYRGQEDRVVTFTPFARSSLDVRLGQSVRLRSGVLLGTTLPRVRVAFGPREAASWGAPFVVATMAVELRLFAFDSPQ